MNNIVTFLIVLSLVCNIISNEIIDGGSKIDDNDDYPRIIWTYFNGSMPYYLREMFELTVNNLNNTWKYILLNEDNMSKYIDVTTLPSHFSLLLPQHQSDIIRLLLLSKYGGWWMDTGIIVNNISVMERMYNRIIREKAEFYGVCIYECPLKDVETSFMYARKGSNLVSKWLEEMEGVYKIGKENYIYKVYREGVNIPELTFTPYPRISPYLVIFAAFEKAVFRLNPRNASIIIESGWDYLYAMHKYANANRNSYKNAYFNEEKRKSFDIIKISGWLRETLFGEKRTTGFESYEPYPLIRGREGGVQKMINMSLLLIIKIFLLFNSLFILCHFFEIVFDKTFHHNYNCKIY